MGRIRKINLSETQRAELEKGYRQSQSSTFSRRCHMILLKGEARTPKDIASIVGTTDQTVGDWLFRYETEGIMGLMTREGQGRRPILKEAEDGKIIREAVEKERQRLKQVKSSLEQQLGKHFSERTLKAFLKKVSADGNASD